jgi:hypothetical protein
LNGLAATYERLGMRRQAVDSVNLALDKGYAWTQLEGS